MPSGALPASSSRVPRKGCSIRTDVSAGRGHDRLGSIVIPGPGVAEPGGRQHVQGVGLRAGVGHGDGHQQVGGIRLRVVDLGDPVAVVVEHPGVEELIFRVVLAAPAVFRPEFLIGKRQLRVMVTPTIPGMAGHGVEIPPIFLDILTVVPLRTSQPESALLQYRVTAVPQRQPQAQALLDVAEAGQAILAPPVGAGTCMVMRQVAPGLTVRAVVLADRAPLALAHVRPPQVPVAGLAETVLEPPEPGYPFTFRTH